MRDLRGKYSFSNDVVFNENLSRRLGVPRPLLSSSDASPPSPSRPVLDRPRTRTAAGQAYDEVLRLKTLHAEERSRRRPSAMSALDGGVDLLPIIDAFHSLIASSALLGSAEVESLGLLELDILWQHYQSSLSGSTNFSPLVFKASTSYSLPGVFDLSKAPSSYSGALAWSDAPLWEVVIDREKQSLQEMGAFEEVDLLPGEWAVGFKWVYAFKTDNMGVNIPGKEKARLVAQGFSQRPGQYDETYAPVAKMASVRVLLAWAAVCDLDIFQFDCKTAFLHAKLRHPIYARPFPGFPISTPGKSLRILVALYGLRQSAYEFYMLLLSLLQGLGMTRCEVDHGIFFGVWMVCGRRPLHLLSVCLLMVSPSFSTCLYMSMTALPLPTRLRCMLGSWHRFLDIFVLLISAPVQKF